MPYIELDYFRDIYSKKSKSNTLTNKNKRVNITFYFERKYMKKFFHNSIFEKFEANFILKFFYF